MSAIHRLGLDPDANPPAAAVVSSSQAQTQDAFSFKWSKRDTYDSEAVRASARNWLLERYCDKDPAR
ncbi:MAG: hypothetical protein ACAI44_09940, partial [Candidatus Sericytochromatia bacterium]